MKSDDLGWGVRSDPRRAECVGRSKTRGLGGSWGVTQKTKNAQNNYLGKVKNLRTIDETIS